MARKRLLTTVKIQLPAGQATPAPPVGTVLGPLTMGQTLSALMIAVGVYLLVRGFAKLRAEPAS